MKKNAIVTGAGRNQGIGAEVCRALAKKGINIYFTSFDEYDTSIGAIKSSDYCKTLDECHSFGVETYFESYDLSKYSSIKTLFDDATSKLGHIDILVNCLCVHQFDSIKTINAPLLELNMQTNAIAVALLCQEFYLRFEGDSGRIVNMSSTQNLEPLTSEIAYAISKAVVPSITFTLAPVMASKKITINAVNPGATEIGDESDRNIHRYLESNQLGRLGKPKDTANLVCFLVSDEGKWISGQTINSEGGIFRGITAFSAIED